jgi:hypothetical protein
MSERQLRRNLAQLQALGLLRAEERPGATTIWHVVEPSANPGHQRPREGGHRRPPHPGRPRPPKQDLRQAEKGKQQQASVTQLDPAHPNAPVGAVVAQEDATRPEKGPEGSARGVGKAGASAARRGAEAGETGSVVPLTLPPDLAELTTRKKGLSSATVRRLVGQAGEATVRTAVELLAEQERKGKTIRSWGAMLTAAVVEGWAAEKAQQQAERAGREAAIGKAAPPDGTTHGRAPDGQLVAVLDVKADAVVTEWGVVLREAWPLWAWQTTPDGSKTEDQHARQEHPKASPPPALARVAVRLKLGKVAEAQALAAQLGVQWDQVLAHQEQQEKP